MSDPAVSNFPSIQVLAKPTGARCNLACHYCFFRGKAQLYPDSRFRMRDDVLEAYVRQTIAAQSAPEVNFSWQGGEPTLMGLDFFRRAVRLVERYLRPGMRVQHAFQTNGMLLNAAWGRFFKTHGFLVGLSLDGTAAMHDAYRVTPEGSPTFAAVMRAARLLRDHDVPFNILATVHAANVEFPAEAYRFLRDESGTQFLQFIPIVEREGASGVTARSVTAEGWGRFLCGVFDEWVRRDVGRVYVQHHDATLASWAGAPPGVCVFEETCGAAVALEHNGDVYACDHFVDPAHLRGNIMRQPLAELVNNGAQRHFGNAKRDALPELCRSCQWLFTCHGECPKNRFATTPDGDPGLSYLCAGYRAYFEHVANPMKFMADCLRRARPPADVMAWMNAARPG
ncbi:MAG: anaerobic sulfatase maturase [bacterium]